MAEWRKQWRTFTSFAICSAVVVLGAGLAGLAAARFLQEIPGSRILILEKEVYADEGFKRQLVDAARIAFARTLSFMGMSVPERM